MLLLKADHLIKPNVLLDFLLGVLDDASPKKQTTVLTMA
jgi:hypothetical protein